MPTKVVAVITVPDRNVRSSITLIFLFAKLGTKKRDVKLRPFLTLYISRNYSE